MKKVQFFKKIKKDPLLLVIVIAIACLIAVNAFLVFSPNKKPLSIYKQYVETKHLELNEVFADIEKEFPGGGDWNKNNLTENYMHHLYNSMVDDSEWFKEKEKQIFNKTMNAQTIEQAKQGFVEMVALDLVFQDVLLLNSYPLQEGFWQYFEDHYQEEIQYAMDKKKTISAENFLKLETNQELLKQSGVKKEAIEKKAVETMSEYIEKRKKEFENALQKNEKLKAFMEANKLIGLHELTVGAQ